ncbi:MAG: trypsin-like peptidase domain-containing protein [Clostridiales bacterium]|jgi:serine protease Do|nr:trypsin-like peptidase domain-containing protein [Clostridiales bacterium]
MLNQYEQLQLTDALTLPKAKRRRRVPKVSAAALVICVAASSLFGFAGGAAVNMLRPENAAVIYSAMETDSQYNVTNLAAVANNSAAAISGTSSAVKQSVVEISTETVATNAWMRQYITGGAGSGVIISADGYVVTNNHVVADARSITVRLANGQKYPAALKGADAQTDLAVIKIEANELTPVVFGDSSKLVVGEPAIAVGNPLGELGGTVTSGIISALDREITIDGENMSLLQTDAAINPGNSGGGLFNISGQLVGVVNAKSMSSSSGAPVEGIGFAIPINTAKLVINDLIKYGYIRGRIDTGISVVDISSVQVAMWYRLNQLGLYITKSTNPELRNGDRITMIDGKSVTYSDSFNAALKSYKVGDTIDITVDRDGRSVTVPITLQEQKH